MALSSLPSIMRCLLCAGLSTSVVASHSHGSPSRIFGNADGSVIERLDYSSTGDFAGGGQGAASFRHDADGDSDLDLRDFAGFQVCFDPSGLQAPQACRDVHDFDTAGIFDGDIDLDDYARFFECFRGPFVTPDQACGVPTRSRAVPPSGTFALHGRPMDVLSDGHTLLYFRARYYDPVNGRWLQRDPTGYVDGGNLYESFANNPLSNLDPTGEGIITWLLIGDYSLSDAQFLRDNGVRSVTTPIYGFFEGGGQTIAGGAREFSLIFTGESAAQQQLVNLVEAEFAIGGATADETGVVMLRATRQGIVDFFGASNVAVAIAGEAAVFAEEGDVFFVDVGGFERVQAGVGGVGQFAAGVGGLGGGGLSQATQLQMARLGLRAAARLAPANRTSQVLFLRAGLAIERAQFALETPVVSAAQAEHVLGLLRSNRPVYNMGARGGGAAYKTWNQFQAGTKGQFLSRAEAARAWGAYKQAAGITTGVVRNQAAKSQFLKGLAESGLTPKWMNQWLRQGKVPPGYQVAHIKPLSVGGADIPSNMRLQGMDLHKTHHRYYRPWE